MKRKAVKQIALFVTAPIWGLPVALLLIARDVWNLLGEWLDERDGGAQ